MDLTNFTPGDGTPWDDFHPHEVFPDAEQIIAEAITAPMRARGGAERDRPEWAQGRAEHYYVAKVPETDVFIFYAVYENPDEDEVAAGHEGIVHILAIRTHVANTN